MGKLYYCPRCGNTEGCALIKGEWLDAVDYPYCTCRDNIPFYDFKEKKKTKLIKTDIDLYEWAEAEEHHGEVTDYFGVPCSVYYYVWENLVDIPENENLNRKAFEEFKDSMENYFKLGGGGRNGTPGYVSSPVAKCPRCGSKSISTQKQGFGVGKAAAGVAVAGAAGALAGGINANKTYNICQNCGHKWTPGK